MVQHFTRLTKTQRQPDKLPSTSSGQAGRQVGLVDVPNAQVAIEHAIDRYRALSPPPAHRLASIPELISAKLPQESTCRKGELVVIWGK